MKFTQFILFVFTLSIVFSCKKSTEKVQPNVLIILTDDQAYGDLSLTGNPIVETPVIDNLAKEGVFAKKFYVSPVCAPTRASLLTGRYHQKTGVSGVTRGRENMNLNEQTFADVFKFLGYKTGAFGKWHNGAHYPYHPLGRGFDEFVGFTSGHWTNYFDTTIEKNGKDFKAEGYLPDVLTDEAIKFIEKSNSKDVPFLCYIPYQTPHTPLQVPDKYFDKYKNKGVDDFNAAIYGMVENIDDNVGEIITKLKELDIEDNTIIIFMSDNGPLNLRYNAGLKGKKGSVNEGGVNVPFIIKWKNKIASSLQINEPLAHIDILPTLLDLVNADVKLKNKIDGKSFKKLILGEKDTSFANRNLFLEWNGNKRLRSGDYVMINGALFNLKKDPSQERFIRRFNQATYDSLRSIYDEWYKKQPEASKEKPIPVGYNKYPTTHLPAHEANLYPPFEFRKDRKHTGIAYHSLYGWAHDWIDFWTNTEAYATWDIEIIESGSYDFLLKYVLSEKDKGTELKLQVGNQTIDIKNIPVFEHSKFPNFDRVSRDQEAPETNWNQIKVGTLKLEKGTHEIKIKTTQIPGEKSIELKNITINKIFQQ